MARKCVALQLTNFTTPRQSRRTATTSTGKFTTTFIGKIKDFSPFLENKCTSSFPRLAWCFKISGKVLVFP